MESTYIERVPSENRNNIELRSLTFYWYSFAMKSSITWWLKDKRELTESHYFDTGDPTHVELFVPIETVTAPMGCVWNVVIIPIWKEDSRMPSLPYPAICGMALRSEFQETRARGQGKGEVFFFFRVCCLFYFVFTILCSYILYNSYLVVNANQNCNENGWVT